MFLVFLLTNSSTKNTFKKKCTKKLKVLSLKLLLIIVIILCWKWSIVNSEVFERLFESCLKKATWITLSTQYSAHFLNKSTDVTWLWHWTSLRYHLAQEFHLNSWMQNITRMRFHHLKSIHRQYNSISKSTVSVLFRLIYFSTMIHMYIF